MIELIKAKRGTGTNAGGGGHEPPTVQSNRTKQILAFDFEAKKTQFEKLAKTSFKFFIANQSVGDYHDNIDSETFFKVRDKSKFK